jgi:hypothetical protein
MGFFDALDNAFGAGTALGAVEGFEQRQYEIGEEQREKDEEFNRRLVGAAKGLGNTMTKRKAFNEQVNTFAAALEKEPSLKDKLAPLGKDGILKLARSALNTRYAEGNASGSKFRVSDFIRQVKRTDPTVLEKYVPKKPSASTGKEKSQEEESITSGLFGNFANILSPTGAGRDRRSIAREKLVKSFPDATEEEIANAIATYGENAGSTNELKTDTPFSVGVALSPSEQIRFEEQGQALFVKLENQGLSPGDPVPEDVRASITKTQDISKKLLSSYYYSQGQGDDYAADITELFTFLKNPDYRKVVDMGEIQALIRDHKFTIEGYMKLLKKKATAASVSPETSKRVVTDMEAAL